MRYMHWSHGELLDCPADVVEAVIRLIEREAASGDNGR